MRIVDDRGAQPALMTTYDAEHGPYRLRRSGDAAWPPRERAYGGQVDTIWRKVALAVLAVARLILPVTLLVTLLAAAYLYSDAWLSMDAAASLARLALERSELQARDQIHSDWQRLNASLIKIEAAAAQVTAASRAAQVARDRYTAGAGTQVDVIQAERDLFSAEVGQIQARTELASARASLRISAGLPLEDR